MKSGGCERERRKEGGKDEGWKKGNKIVKII